MVRPKVGAVRVVFIVQFPKRAVIAALQYGVNPSSLGEQGFLNLEPVPDLHVSITQASDQEIGIHANLMKVIAHNEQLHVVRDAVEALTMSR